MPCSSGVPLWHWIWWRKGSVSWLQSWLALESRFQCGPQGVQIYLYPLESTLESRLSDWPAMESRPRFLLPPNPMPKWNSGGARHQQNTSQYLPLVLKGVFFVVQDTVFFLSSWSPPYFVVLDTVFLCPPGHGLPLSTRTWSFSFVLIMICPCKLEHSLLFLSGIFYSFVAQDTVFLCCRGWGLSFLSWTQPLFVI